MAHMLTIRQMIALAAGFADAIRSLYKAVHRFTQQALGWSREQSENVFQL